MKIIVSAAGSVVTASAVRVGHRRRTKNTRRLLHRDRRRMCSSKTRTTADHLAGNRTAGYFVRVRRSVCVASGAGATAAAGHVQCVRVGRSETIGSPDVLRERENDALALARFFRREAAATARRGHFGGSRSAALRSSAKNRRSVTHADKANDTELRKTTNQR